LYAAANSVVLYEVSAKHIHLSPGKFACGAVLVLILVLIAITHHANDLNVWEGWTESRELQRPSYGERIYVTDVFRTRANTWSNLAVVFVGFYSLAFAWNDRRREPSAEAGYLARTPALSVAFGLACCNLGIASGLFHASLTRFGQHLDVASMYAPLLVLIAVSLGRRIPSLPLLSDGRRLPTWPIWIALVVVASVLLFLFKWSMSSIKVLSTLIATVSVLSLLDGFRAQRRFEVRWLVLAGTALVAGIACRQLDVARRFTGPDAWLQGHAVWHLLTSFSLCCIYRYHHSETTQAR
jgi:predicted membrane channel-forming protein YqfA (hemolysin III family)